MRPLIVADGRSRLQHLIFAVADEDHSYEGITQVQKYRKILKIFIIFIHWSDKTSSK